MFGDTAHSDLIKKAKSGHPWCMLSLVDKNGKVTDENAIQYAMDKFNVLEDQIELKRTGGGILVRQKIEEEAKFLSFNEFVREVYGVPTRDDPYYKEYKEFGYEVWLVKSFPDEWGTGDRGKFLSELEQDFYMHCLEIFFGVELGDDLTVLEEYLLDRDIYSIKQRFPMDIPCIVDQNTFAVNVWDADNDKTFVIIFDGDGMYLMVLANKCLEKSNEKFEGFEE